jgi:EAL domain-containing protein (putative c-di-GMP-specific phosphodiesterase class I)
VRQLIGQNFPATVIKILEETGLPANRLELEITESLLVQDSDELVATIHRIKDIGVTLALDDFGTGYSSLSYLKRFPFDILKIDRAFIKDLIDNVEDASLCKAIVAIASSLKLNVIGEGVETREQLAFLREIGTDMVQGYLYSKPLEITPFIDYVKTFHAFEHQ